MLSSELELGIGNTCFKKKGINKLTWHRNDNGRLLEIAMMDYVLVEKSVMGMLVDVHVARGPGGRVSDHFLEVAKVKGGGVGFGRKKEQVQYYEIIKVSELSKKEKE